MTRGPLHNALEFRSAAVTAANAKHIRMKVRRWRRRLEHQWRCQL